MKKIADNRNFCVFVCSGIYKYIQAIAGLWIHVWSIGEICWLYNSAIRLLQWRLFVSVLLLLYLCRGQH